MEQLRGRVALITGASRGLGVHIARRLAREGMRLALAARSADSLEALALELRARGCEAFAYETDVRDTGACERLVATVREELGPVEILVNNAGIERTGLFEQQSFEENRDVVDVNLLGPLRLVHAVLPGMLEAGSGHIVVMGSVAGYGGLPHAASYAATKAALLALANSLRIEFGARGVSASTIVPGFVHGAGMYEDQKARTGGRASPWILGSSTPERVADAMVRAIRKDRPEVIVNSVPMRFLLALGRLFPRFGLWLVRRSSGAYTSDLAQARARTRPGGR
jgi:short-subunit dehydrogenase